MLSWSWGARAASGAETSAELGSTPGVSEGAGAVVNELVVAKYWDASSPKLMQALASGQVVPQAVLTVRSEEGQRVRYLVITMTEVMVTSVSTGSSGSVRPTESITLNFTKIEFEYQKLDSAGSPIGEPGGFEVSKTKHNTAMASIRNIR